MAEMFYEEDAELALIQSKTVAVLGYGSQGRAHALNLRDSGVNVVIGLRQGSPSAVGAQEAGFTVQSIAQAVAQADLVAVLVPDQVQPALYLGLIEPNLKPGAALVFAHGFNIHFGYLKPASDHDVIMIAPKDTGYIMRREFEAGRGVPMLVGVDQDDTGEAWPLVLSYAKALGGLRAGVLKTTFREETETDLFGTQSVLCGGLSKLITAGFDVLTQAGYQPEIAYFAVCQEMKTIMDLIYQGGISAMHRSISDIAEYGDYVAGPRVIDETVKQHMETVLNDIQNGVFARRFMADQAAGAPELKKLRAAGEYYPIEAVGQSIRSLFSWDNQAKDAGYHEGSATR